MGNKVDKPCCVFSDNPLTVSVGGHEYIRCRVLGKGAFGKVYAVQLAADKTVTRAVKEMSKSQILARGENTTNLLIAERQLLTGRSILGVFSHCRFGVLSFCRQTLCSHARRATFVPYVGLLLWWWTGFSPLYPGEHARGAREVLCRGAGRCSGRNAHQVQNCSQVSWF